MYKVFIVEDDKIISGAVEKYLSRWGYEVRTASDFNNVLNEFAEFSPHIVLMDISLPFFNGFYWCSQIRKTSSIPIIFISSASDSMDIVMAVNMGGDDYIIKPFDLSILAVKVQALLRRAYDFSAPSNVIEHRGALLNINDATLSYENTKAELTRSDFKILQLLMEHSGQVVSRSDIMAKLWESDNFVDDNALTVSINRLRKKLDSMGLEGFIKTKKGLGYIVE